ncbi:hypothetical protein QUF64_00815 [Anaerolineales bacterium HSG6]|nr:hypothetical protein [Anaerolineales bacterium HSG6]
MYFDSKNRILALLNKQRAALEAEIDQLVYQLYDLTPAEIAIVEGRS